MYNAQGGGAARPFRCWEGNGLPQIHAQTLAPSRTDVGESNSGLAQGKAIQPGVWEARALKSGEIPLGLKRCRAFVGRYCA